MCACADCAAESPSGNQGLALLQVIPKAGGTVVILVGPRRGEEATVEQILTDDFQVELKLLSTGQRVREEYECVSKLLT